jgi:pantoate--beta-alanine ligase
MTASAHFVVTSDIGEARLALDAARRAGQSIGFVPTMGALHEGHLSLIERARAETDYVVVSIFVNPSQFNDAQDLEAYPRPVGQDLTACRDARVNLVFLPDAGTLYPDGFNTWVTVEGLSTILEGAAREGHFRGVATIVLKLLNIIQPVTAYFGAKDYQQQVLIRQMVRDLDVPVSIAVCPTVRDDDGLALSSRNARLTRQQRRSATALCECLCLAEELIRSGEDNVVRVRQAMLDHLNSREDVEADYAVLADPDTLAELSAVQPHMLALVAARVGEVRLIDNRTIELEDDG